ncbi:UDP-3-O-(3-hydroxymyristoyl)glucosamine N-acyltransferase [Algoriphagus taiwanensis]|uniref:UDP-3-O-(3-hydroxymyristoyl)glucosamine N-acyltransferase n=1 Tax=Algoriphagus taiwanensis TaxID=1445656 RepID=A0ABQ6Q3Q8_9BACT|nr:UDP-3-O-(3-hydroxymyristoyl)glucosamine N-acyltransferase [Algoriphagus taiwanensis]
MNKVSIKKISDVLVDEEVYASRDDIYFTKASPINNTAEYSITWVKKNLDKSLELIQNSLSTVIVLDRSLKGLFEIDSNKAYILSDDPKSTFINILNFVFPRERTSNVHSTSIISNNSKVGLNCYIGPNVTIEDNCTIGDNCVLLGNNYIFSGTNIGNFVTINPGSVIGSDGFGYARKANGELNKFPHFGGVQIGDYVEIGANVCIDRGTLGDTIIKSGVKIDNLVHVAHNVVVGENSLLIANSMIGGSTVIGKNSWIAPSVNLMNGISIEENVTVGMGATVTKNIPSGETWAGSPARPIKEFIRIQNIIKNL